VVFAGILLFISGTLNVIYGIAAISDSKFFTENATYILSKPQYLGLGHADHRCPAALRRAAFARDVRVCPRRVGTTIHAA
jgi:hypothetical protein